MQGHSGVHIKKQLQNFDCQVSRKTYSIEFELLAGQNGWDGVQRAVPLATILKSTVLEILSQLSEDDKSYYSSLDQMLERCGIVSEWSVQCKISNAFKG